jgi:hypothetical protein
MPSFLVAALNPLTLPDPPAGSTPVKFVTSLYIVDATNDQAAIDRIADWDSAPVNTDYLAIPFNPKRRS